MKCKNSEKVPFEIVWNGKAYREKLVATVTKGKKCERVVTSRSSNCLEQSHLVIPTGFRYFNRRLSFDSPGYSLYASYIAYKHCKYAIRLPQTSEVKRFNLLIFVFILPSLILFQHFDSATAPGPSFNFFGPEDTLKSCDRCYAAFLVELLPSHVCSTNWQFLPEIFHNYFSKAYYCSVSIKGSVARHAGLPKRRLKGA